VMNNAAASVSTSTGGLLSLTEPIMEIQNREDPTRNRDQPPCSIPPTGRGHPGVCAEPLRLDDGGCAYDNTSSDAVVPAPRFSFVFDEVVWRGELVHLLQDNPGRVSRCCIPPALADGDPCQQCPGWFRLWHDKLQRPFWYHHSEGGTWRRPDGWRGTDFPFPIIVLRRHFCDWRDAVAVERVRRTVRWNLCQRSFRHWAWPVEDEDDDACWAHLDYASD
jgi:hypothetical protein